MLRCVKGCVTTPYTILTESGEKIQFVYSYFCPNLTINDNYFFQLLYNGDSIILETVIPVNE